MSDTRTKTQQQLAKNTEDISEIRQTLTVLRENHLFHIEKDMAELREKVKAMDARLWWILALLVSTTIVSLLGDRMFH